jgi:hypothetical protein
MPKLSGKTLTDLNCCFQMLWLVCPMFVPFTANVPFMLRRSTLPNGLLEDSSFYQKHKSFCNGGGGT